MSPTSTQKERSNDFPDITHEIEYFDVNPHNDISNVSSPTVAQMQKVETRMNLDMTLEHCNSVYLF